MNNPAVFAKAIVANRIAHATAEQDCRYLPLEEMGEGCSVTFPAETSSQRRLCNSAIPSAADRRRRREPRWLPQRPQCASVRTMP